MATVAKMAREGIPTNFGGVVLGLPVREAMAQSYQAQKQQAEQLLQKEGTGREGSVGGETEGGKSVDLAGTLKNLVRKAAPGGKVKQRAQKKKLQKKGAKYKSKKQGGKKNKKKKATKQQQQFRKKKQQKIVAATRSGGKPKYKVPARFKPSVSSTAAPRYKVPARFRSSLTTTPMRSRRPFDMSRMGPYVTATGASQPEYDVPPRFLPGGY